MEAFFCQGWRPCGLCRIKALRSQQTTGVGLLPALDAVVLVDVAGGAEGLVVEAGGAGGFLELFAELVDGAEMVGGGGDLQAAGLEELLVATVEQAGDLSAEQPA